MTGKYNYTDKEIKLLLNSIVVVIDTKEKANQHILDWFDKNKIPHIKKNLSHGDYSFYLPKNEELGIARDTYFTDKRTIERKNSVDEIIGNFATDRNRIEDEFLRHKGKMTLVIENDSYGDIVDGNYRSKYSNKAAVGTLHSFCEKYDIGMLFIPKASMGCFIYSTFYYYLRSLIK